jgi:hypothetical protein
VRLSGARVVPAWFDAAGKLLYVGKTNNYARRSDEHKDKPWWKDVAVVAGGVVPVAEGCVGG